MTAKKKSKWMQGAVNLEEKGELHKKLKVPTDKKIPTALLKKKKKELQERAEGDKKLTKAERELLGQIQFALNARKADLLANLVKVANELDAAGLSVEASEVDAVLDLFSNSEELQKQAATLPVRRLSPQAAKAKEAKPIIEAAQTMQGTPENVAILVDILDNLEKLK